MKKLKFQSVIAFALKALGLESLPKGEDGKLSLDADQEAVLKSSFTGENFAAFQKVANEILAEEAGQMEAEQAEADKVNGILASVLKGNQGSEEGEEEPSEATPEANAKKVVSVVKEQQATIKKLMDAPENDATVQNVIKKALLPDPASLGPRTVGKTNIGCIFTGKKDGKEKTIYIYNVCDHQECYKEVGSQAISYTTGVPAMIGAALVVDKVWDKDGVFNIEEFDPDPFMDMLNQYGLPWVVDENPQTVA